MPGIREELTTTERQRLAARCEEIMASAKDAKRDLSDAEANEFDVAMEKLLAHKRASGGTWKTRGEAIEMLSESMGAIVGPQMYEPPGADWHGATSTTRALQPTESVRSFLQSQGRTVDPEYRGVSCGDAIRAYFGGAKTPEERAALSAGVDPSGGYLVPTLLSATVIDRMRAKLVVSRAGARTIPAEGNEMVIAKVVDDPTPEWRNENELVTESEITFGSVAVRPKVLACIIRASRELLEGASNAGDLIEQILADTFARKLDEACLIGAEGSAGSWIQGIDGTDGVLAEATSGSLAYPAILAARTALLGANAEEPTALCLSVRDEGALSALTDGVDNPAKVPAAIERLPLLATTAIPVDAGVSTAYLGDFRQLMIAMRSSFRVQPLQERFADRLQVGFLAWLWADVVIMQPRAFCRITGIGS